MVTIVVFHVLMLVLGLSIVTGVVPARLVGTMLGYAHNTIGITMPPAKKVKMFALIWIGSTVVIVDGCISLLLFITSMSHLG